MVKKTRHRVSPRMTRVARRLRRDMTYPERVLWHLLRSRNAGDLKFRRQHVVGPFAVDFYCSEAKLVVEVDGESHDDPEADARRTVYLEAQGLKVFRVTNDQVLQQRLAVMDAILDVAEERLEQRKNPHPNPLPRRERE